MGGRIQWSDGPAIESLWGGIRTVDGEVTTVVINESWNAERLRPGASYSMGFTACRLVATNPARIPHSSTDVSISMTVIPDTGGSGSDGGGDASNSPCMRSGPQ